MKSVTDMYRLMYLAACLFVSVSALAGTLRLPHEMGFRGAESLDPISPTRFIQANQMIYDRLVRQAPTGELEPQLSINWQCNDRADQWSFDLRSNVRFHNGKLLDAEDVAYSFRRVVDPKTRSAVSAVLGIIKEVTVLSSLRVLFKLNAPHSEFPVLLADHRARILPAQPALDSPVLGIGTGPFKLVHFDPEGVTRLTANSDYWDGVPKTDQVELLAIADSNSRLKALLAGQIDWLETVVRKQRPLFEKHRNLWLQFIETGKWRGITFRNDMPPFDDPRVRKAVRIAVDRNKIMQLVSGKEGGSISCDSPVWPGDPYWADLQCQQDIASAKALLAKAGYSEGLAFDLYTSDIEPEFIPMAEAYQQQVAKAGITVTIRRVPADSYWQSYWKQVSAIMTHFCQRPADQILNEAFRSGALWNDSGFNRPEFDQLLDNARSEFSTAEKQHIYRQLQEFLYDTGGTLIPYHISQMRVLSKRVELFDAMEYFAIPWHKIAVKD